MMADGFLEPTECGNGKKRCPDCLQCQMCGETRCRICRKDARKESVSGLTGAFTHGEYLAWKRKRGENLNG